MSKEAHDMLMGGGAKAFSFAEVGATVTGTVVSYEKAPDTDMDGKVRTWPSGDPRFQIIFTLQTDIHDDEDDDGMRRVFVNKPQMKHAIAEACRAAKWTDNLVGGKLSVKFVRTEKAQVRGHNPKKVFEAKFIPPKTAAEFEAEEQAADSDIPF